MYSRNEKNDLIGEISHIHRTAETLEENIFHGRPYGGLPREILECALKLVMLCARYEGEHGAGGGTSVFEKYDF